ncbi:MAG: fibronectin type III domain-containing protein, partial [Candidatus Acidiferrales bacterium]
IGNLTAQITKTAVELSWTAPKRTTSGAPLAGLAGYRVYRAEVDPEQATQALADPSKAKTVSPLELEALTPSPHYRDTQFQFGHTYLYSVRSVTQFEADSVESRDSNLLAITPRSIFPPAAPEDLVSAFVPATDASPAHLELSWSISEAPDVSGYNIYRSEDAANRGERLNREWLPTPAFRDMSALPGHSYFYTVTAVDRAGNESAPSAPLSVTVPEVTEKKNP